MRALPVQSLSSPAANSASFFLSNSMMASLFACDSCCGI